MCAIHESLLWFFLSAKAWAEEERRMGCAVWWIGFKFLDGCGVGEPDFSRGVMELEDEEDVRMGLRESGLSWSDMRGYWRGGGLEKEGGVGRRY